MSRVLLVLLALLTLTAAVAWYALAGDTSRRAPAAARVEDVAETSVTPSTTSSPTAVATSGDSPLAQAVERDARAVVTGAHEQALANAHWIEGRVLFPPGTPADEALTVVADGRDFDDGGDHRAPVERDGRFRVAFSERTRTGKLRLEGRYLFLREPGRWTRDAREPVVLEPELGARIVVDVLPPAGVPPTDVRGEVALSITRQSGSALYFGSDEDRTTAVDVAREVSFDALDIAREYRVSFDGEGCVSEWIAVPLERGRSAVVQLALQPGTLITGRVHDEAGDGVAGAELMVLADDPASNAFAGRFRFAESGSDGSYRVGAFPAGKLDVKVTHRDFEPFELELLAPPEGGTLEVEHVLVRGVSISGTVRWPDGEPAAGQVRAIERTENGGHSYASQRKEVLAGEDGSFRISGLTGRHYLVQVDATHTVEVPEVSPVTGRERMRKRRSRWVAEVEDVAVGTTGLALVLSPGLALRGRVIDTAGVPLDNAYIVSERVGFPSDTGEGGGQAPSGRFRNDDGSFELAGFHPGLWNVSARAPGYCRSDPVQVRVPSGERIELRLEREATVRGVVLGVDGMPAAGIEVTVLQPGHGEGQFDLYVKPHDETDAEGTFSVDNLHSGIAHLTATAPSGISGETLDVELVAGETLAGLVLTLRPGCSLEGVVIDRHGRPEAGVYVQFDSLDRSATRSFRTDGDGRFQGRGMPPGPGNVFAQNHDGLSLFAEVELRVDSVARVRLAAPDTAPVRVFGRVLSGGRPLEGAWVMARRAEMDASSPVTWGAVQSRERSDAQGRYELRLPGSGRWLVHVREPGSGTAGWTLPLDVPEVEEFEHDFALGAGLVRGRVRSASGEALEGISVRSEPRNHDGGPRGQAATTTDAEGRYELSVPVGRHTLVAGGSSGRGPATDWCAARIEDLRVEDGSSRDGLDFELVQGGSLSGAVRAPEGGPARFVSLWSCAASGTELLGHSDDGGGFQLSGLPEGTLWIRASGPSAATPAATSVTIRRDAAARVELELVAGAPLRVRVLDAAGAPLGSEVDVRDAGGRPVPAIASGEMGEATFGPLTPGTYRVRARREEQLVERTLEVSGLEGELELVLGFD